MKVIDGSMGEGGGQVLRTSLTLAALTATPLRIENIRGRRRNPGLMRQHLTAARAVAAVCGGTLRGDEVRSTELELTPGPPRAGEYTFSVGTAGSTMLVLQTVLPLLLHSEGRSTVVFEGGTHNHKSPAFDFVEHAFVPVLRRMGAEISLTLERPGFYPAGGGSVRVEVEGRAGGPDAPVLRPLELIERGDLVERRARIWMSGIPSKVAEREAKEIGDQLQWTPDEIEVVTVDEPRGPGNVVTLTARYGQVAEVFTGFGARERHSARVVGEAVQEYKRYLVSSAAVAEHLADQLMLPCALAGGGQFTTTRLSRHAKTQVELIPRFLDCALAVEPLERDRVMVRIG